MLKRDFSPDGMGTGLRNPRNMCSPVPRIVFHPLLPANICFLVCANVFLESPRVVPVAASAFVLAQVSAGANALVELGF